MYRYYTDTWHTDSADISNLQQVRSEIHTIASTWKDLGLALGVHNDELDNIDANNRNVQSCLREVLTTWLKKAYTTTPYESYKAPSWEWLMMAVADPIGGNNPALAEKIAHNQNGKFS